MMASRGRTLVDQAPEWLILGGVGGFLLLGVAGGLAIVVYGYQLTIGVTLPLLIAVIVGVTVEPLVVWFERHKVNRMVGTTLTMLILFGVIVGAIFIVISGFVSQWPLISDEIAKGLAALGTGLQKLNVTTEQLANIEAAIRANLPSITEGIGASLGKGLAGIVSFLFGAFIGVYILFYVLKDYRLLSRWAGAHLGLPTDVGVAIVDDGAGSIRGYFKGQTIVAAVNTVVVVIGLIIFKVPLIGPIAIVTFVLAYIPYLGAFISGAFAVLIALGSGGVYAALGILAVVLISQNLVQTPVSSWAVGSELGLHPLAVLLATMLGGVLAGALGATLGAPIVAVSVSTTKRLREARAARATASESARGENPRPASEAAG